jgi:hypothetical protein
MIIKNKTTQKLIKKLAVPIIALNIGNVANAQENGNIEMNISKKPLVETNLFYKSDKLKINGFTSIDYYFKDKEYSGTTNLDTKLSKNFSLESQIHHFNEPFTKIGIGASYKIPTDKINAKVGFLPLRLDKEGNFIKKSISTKYSIGINLPKNFSLNTFGQFTINSKGGPKWEYGEIDLSKKFGKDKKWEISYNPSLKAQGKFSPKYTHRIALRRKF